MPKLINIPYLGWSTREKLIKEGVCKPEEVDQLWEAYRVQLDEGQVVAPVTQEEF